MSKKEIEITISVCVSGTIVPFVPAQGPTYDSGGQPAAGGYCEDVQVYMILDDGKTRLDITHMLSNDSVDALGAELYDDAKTMSRDAYLYDQDEEN